MTTQAPAWQTAFCHTVGIRQTIQAPPLELWWKSFAGAQGGGCRRGGGGGGCCRRRSSPHLSHGGPEHNLLEPLCIHPWCPGCQRMQLTARSWWLPVRSRRRMLQSTHLRPRAGARVQPGTEACVELAGDLLESASRHLSGFW
jgi:hypothetical protein